MKICFLKYCILFSLVWVNISAQEPLFELGQWKHTHLNGSVQLEGLYRSQETILKDGKTEKPVTKKFIGELLLSSKSYIWHPNFWRLNIDIDYNPGVQNEQFLVIPNRTETRTAEQLRIQSVFFNQRPFSVNSFFNISHHFINREFASNVESINMDYGGSLAYRNLLAPVKLQYLHSDWQQNELQTGRKFLNERDNVQFELSRSFMARDRHIFTYSYEDYKRRYGSGFRIRNIMNSWRLQNRIPFSENRKSFWQSNLFYRQQEGSMPFNRLQINEYLSMGLPFGFYSIGRYRYVYYDEFIFFTRQHQAAAELGHQLFRSLQTTLTYEYIDISHTSYHEYTNQGELSFDYQKMIPTGRLRLGYTYRLRRDNRDSDSDIVRITREPYTLRDDETVLLQNPDLDPSSVVVTDQSGTIIYEKNIDYVLIPRGEFLEIQRLPGGQIDNGQLVLVSYTVILLQSYTFDTNSHRFYAALSLFDQWIDLYFRYQEQFYDHVIKADDKNLKSILQHVYGIRLSKMFFTLGFEYDQFFSNITPYLSKRYYLTLSHHFQNQLSVALTGNWRNRELLSDQEKQNFADLSGRLGYALSRQSEIRLDGGYRFQKGRGIDLDLSNIRLAYSITYRQIDFSVGIEIYHRDFSGEVINYNGAFLIIKRNF